MKTDTRKFIALADTLAKLFVSEYNTPEIRVTIAVLGKDKDGRAFPNNWSRDYSESKRSTGGCFARIFASDSCDKTRVHHYFGCYGPDVRYGEVRDYEHATRAIKRINAGMDKIREARGCTDDAADTMGRWLESAGVTEVWIRPNGTRDSGWLSDGQWETPSVGRFVDKVRQNYAQQPALEAVAA